MKVKFWAEWRSGNAISRKLIMSTLDPCLGLFKVILALAALCGALYLWQWALSKASGY